MLTQPQPLISADTLQKRIAELGNTLSSAYPPHHTLVFIGILRGSLYFLADLSRAVTQPVEIDFMSVSSYQGTKSTGKVTLKQDIEIDICNKDVFIIEDIVDTGRTLQALIQHLQHKNPRSLNVCTLLDKPSKREVSVPIHYYGFCIDDHFVVGYGLDYDQAYRNIPYIGILSAT